VSETLSSQFQKSRGTAIEVNGRLVQSIFQKQLNEPNVRFEIHRVKSVNSPTQGFRLKAVQGTIEVNGQHHPDIILWADTCPAVMEIVVSSHSGCQLKAWNVWKIDDLVQAWVGNAGMCVLAEGNSYTLECSDGVGDVDFTNLIVQVKELH
jgi:hypothetical protein